MIVLCFFTLIIKQKLIKLSLIKSEFSTSTTGISEKIQINETIF